MYIPQNAIITMCDNDNNLVYNGNMELDQRYGGASITSSLTNIHVPTIDRHLMFQSQANKLSFRKLNIPSFTKDGCNNYLSIQPYSSVSSLGSSDFFIYSYIVEGFDSARLMWGTSEAKQITISCLATASPAGIYPITIQNADFSRTYLTTINVTNELQKVYVTIPGCTNGNWKYDNNQGLRLRINLATGNGYNTTTTNTWSTLSSGISTTSCVNNFMSSTSNYFYMTALKIEEGDTHTTFKPMDFPDNLNKCQRYYEISDGYAYENIWNGNITSGQPYRTGIDFKVQKRYAPIVNVTHQEASGFDSSNPTMVTTPNLYGFACYKTANSSSSGYYRFSWKADAEFTS